LKKEKLREAVMYRFACFIVFVMLLGCGNTSNRITDKTWDDIAKCTGGLDASGGLKAKIEASIEEKETQVGGNADIDYEQIIKGVIFSDPTISEELKKFYFAEYQKCMDKIRNASDPIVACPDNYQSHYISQLGFGFCYPRHGWELDRGAIDIRAADIFLRYASNRDVSIHYHVSMIPSNFSDKHEDYSNHVANTWKQLDPNLKMSKSFLSGRRSYNFKLYVKDRNSISRPTEVTHVYLSPEKLLEIIVTRFEDTAAEVIEQQARILSSTSLFK